MGNTSQLVTIGICCFNAELDILDAIESAIQQRWTKKQIIVIDDCSTDNSFEIIKNSEYINQIELFKNKENRGPAFTRNEIIKNAKGEFICFFDDDDISDSSRIEEQVRSIFRAGYPSNKYIISTCGIKRQYKNGYFLNLKSMGSDGDLPKNNELADYLLFSQNVIGTDFGFCSPTCSMLLTKNCFDSAGLFDESLRRVEDTDITIRFSLSGYVFTNVDKILVTQRSTSGNDKSPKMNLDSEIRVIKKNKFYLSKKGLYLYSRLWPYLRFFHFKRNYLFLIIILLFLIIRYPNRALPHFFRSAYRRYLHERKIKSVKG